MDSEWTTSGGSYEEKDDSKVEERQGEARREGGSEVKEARIGAEDEEHEDGKVKRETEENAQEGKGEKMEEKKKKEDSPGDLRYETLIKIISSASVGCRGAYTTASRECSDLNGNNSVKDGCSLARPCTSLCPAFPMCRAAPRPLPHDLALFVLHERE